MSSDQRPPDAKIDLEGLKALAHPVRVQLIDLLSMYGPDTATGLADRLGESSGSTSYHLRQLAKHGFIREVVGRGSARERWWERTPGSIDLDARRVADTEAGRAAARMVVSQWQHTKEQLLADYIERSLDAFDDRWIDAATLSTANLRLTSDQLAALTARIQDVIDEAVAGHRGRDEPGSRPVQVQFNAFPLVEGEETPL